MHNKSRIAAVAAFAHRPNDGLIVLGGPNGETFIAIRA
jgi:hypothetical protein